MLAKVKAGDTVNVYDHPIAAVYVPLVGAALFFWQEAGRQINANPNDPALRAISDAGDVLDSHLSYYASPPISDGFGTTKSDEEIFLRGPALQDEVMIANVFRTTIASVRKAVWASYVQIAKKGTLLSADAVTKIMTGANLPTSTLNKKTKDPTPPSAIPTPPKSKPKNPAPPSAIPVAAIAVESGLSAGMAIAFGLGGLWLVYYLTQQKDGTSATNATAAA